MKRLLSLLISILIINTLAPSVVIANGTLLTKNLPKDKEYIVFIEVNELTLSLIDKETKKFEKIYPISIGRKNTPSPIGTWKISSKAIKDGPFGGHWLGLSVPWDTFGIHGTSNPSSIGSMASGGCIRMYNHHIEEVFNLVDYNTVVIVYGGPSWLFSSYARNIIPNDKGADVYHVQRRLKDLGYYNGVIDGIYGYPLELSILKYKKENNISGDSEIDQNFLDSIGLWKFE